MVSYVLTGQIPADCLLYNHLVSNPPLVIQ